MRLPAPLAEAIAELAATIPPRELAAAARELSDRYLRADFSSAVLRTPAHRIAYLATRMPATYMATLHALRETARRLPDARMESVLDLGAGPGTAGWAAAEIFAPQRITLIERDAQMTELGRKFGLPNANWIAADISRYEPEPADLVVISYAISELPADAARTMLERAWKAAKKAMVVVEPGTPRAFQNVLLARTFFVQSGGHLVAPCPHEFACPMAAAGDWCHFAERVERTAEHRRLKGGELGYEDEKFSYVAAARQEVARPAARIVRHPLKLSGHVKLSLCVPNGIEQRTVTRSQKESYRRARKAEWGDAWAE